MKEIKCPKCQTVFTIDESEYASIVKQVHDDEFNKALEDRLKIEKERNQKDIELAKQNEKLEAERRIKQLEQTIASLNNKISDAEKDKKLAISDSNREKEAKISDLEKEINGWFINHKCLNMFL